MGTGYDVGASPDGLDNVLNPETPGNGAATNFVAGALTFQGGCHQVLRRLVFNRLDLRVATNATPGHDLVVGIYQAPDGIGSPVMALVRSYSVTVNAIGNLSLVGDAVLAPGVCSIVWGSPTLAAAFSLTTWNTASKNLINTNVVPGARVIEFDTTVVVVDPAPVSINLAEGGGSVVAGVDNALVARVRRV